VAVLVADLIAFAPEFTSTDTGVIQSAIDMAERRTAREQWLSKADDGVSMLAAHILTLKARPTQEAKGPITAEAVQPASRAYAAPQNVPWGEAWFASTNYGQEYIALRAQIFSDRIGDCL